MNPYPKKTCEIDRLICHPKLAAAAISGEKTQQRRDGIYAYPGEIFELEGTRFIVTALERQSLGEMTDMDANAEGYPNLNLYKDLIIKMHPGMTWNTESMVWVHTFKRMD